MNKKIKNNSETDIVAVVTISLLFFLVVIVTLPYALHGERLNSFEKCWSEYNAYNQTKIIDCEKYVYMLNNLTHSSTQKISDTAVYCDTNYGFVTISLSNIDEMCDELIFAEIEYSNCII